MANKINQFTKKFDFDKWQELAKLDEKTFEVQRKLTLCGIVSDSQHHRDLLRDQMLKIGFSDCCKFVAD